MNRIIVASLVLLSIFLSSGKCFQGHADIKEPSNEIQNGNTQEEGSITALDIIQSMFSECLSEGSFSCFKHKFLSFLSSSVKNDNYLITKDLVITRKQDVPVQIRQVNEAERMTILQQLDKFLLTHELKMKVPEELQFTSGFLKHIPREVKVPLADLSVENQEESRGFMKKIVLPFLLALKFKVSAVVPLALTLIALKTWKALTLGLLSIVLSLALIMLKVLKPKIVNYEVLHYPAVEHYHDHHGYGKSLDGHKLAYRYSR